MNLVEITSKKEWDGFVSILPYAQFCQSFTWGELQASQGHDVKRFFIQEENETLAAIQLIHQARMIVGGYWLAPRGPVGDLDKNVMELFATKLELPKNLFIRVEPPEIGLKI